MIPYVPVIIVHEGVELGKALELKEECIVVSKNPFSKAIVALTDMSALMHETQLVERSGRRIPAGTIYALRCKTRKRERVSEGYLHICSIEERLYVEELGPEDVSDLSIPVMVSGMLTRVDERYITRL